MSYEQQTHKPARQDSLHIGKSRENELAWMSNYHEARLQMETAEARLAAHALAQQDLPDALLHGRRATRLQLNPLVQPTPPKDLIDAALTGQMTPRYFILGRESTTGIFAQQMNKDVRIVRPSQAIVVEARTLLGDGRFDACQGRGREAADAGHLWAAGQHLLEADDQKHSVETLVEADAHLRAAAFGEDTRSLEGRIRWETIQTERSDALRKLWATFHTDLSQVESHPKEAMYALTMLPEIPVETQRLEAPCERLHMMRELALRTAHVIPHSERRPVRQLVKHLMGQIDEVTKALPPTHTGDILQKITTIRDSIR
jgi:hypothetical protein